MFTSGCGSVHTSNVSISQVVYPDNEEYLKPLCAFSVNVALLYCDSTDNGSTIYGDNDEDNPHCIEHTHR